MRRRDGTLAVYKAYHRKPQNVILSVLSDEQRQEYHDAKAKCDEDWRLKYYIELESECEHDVFLDVDDDCFRTSLPDKAKVSEYYDEDENNVVKSLFDMEGDKKRKKILTSLSSCGIPKLHITSNDKGEERKNMTDDEIKEAVIKYLQEAELNNDGRMERQVDDYVVETIAEFFGWDIDFDKLRLHRDDGFYPQSQLASGEMNNNTWSGKHLWKIIEVDNDLLKNRRVYLLYSMDGENQTYNNDFKFGVAKHTYEEHNYLDKNRYRYGDNFYFFDECDDDYVKANINHLRAIPDGRDGRNFLHRNEAQRILRGLRIEEARLIKQNKMTSDARKRIRGVLDIVDEGVPTDAEPYTFNKLKFYHDRVEYENNTLSIIGTNTRMKNDKPLTYSLTSEFYSAKRDKLARHDLNFDMMLDAFLDYLERKLVINQSVDTLRLQIGQVMAEVTRGVTGRMFINGKAVKKDEIKRALEQMICYTDQASYDGIISGLRKCSYQVWDFVNNGAQFEVCTGFSEPSYYSRRGGKPTSTHFIHFDFERLGDGKNYLLVGNKRFRVENINRFYTWSTRNTKTPRHQLRYRKPHHYRSFFGEVLQISDKNLDELMEGAKKIYEEKKAQVKATMDATVKAVGAKAGDFNGNPGYFVTGMSGTRYFLETKTARVYQADTNTHLCITDRSSMGNFAEGKLITRLSLLRNDKTVAKEVYTLRV